MSREKHKNRVLKYILIVLFLIVIISGIFLVVNYRNVVAFYKGMTTDADTLSGQLDKNKQDTADALINSGINVSEEDMNKLNDGNLTKEEIADLLLGSMEKLSGEDEKKEEQKKEEELPVGDSTKEDNQPAEKEKSDIITEIPEVVPEIVPDIKDNGLSEQEYNKKVAELVAQVYVIQTNFNSTLNEFENRIISEYKALPPEQRTASTKAKIVADNMAYMVGLEAQCDAQIKEVTDALTKLMTENNKDTALVDSIKKAYENEKELKKAYYISLYK